MKEELATKLKNAGFPTVTKWEVENNYRRSISVTGQDTLPPLGALISEINRPMFLYKMGNNSFGASVDQYNEDLDQKPAEETGPFNSYIDTRTEFNFISKTPEEAVVRLWLELKAKSLLSVK